MILEKLQIIATVSLDFYTNNIKTINVKQCDTNTRFIHVYFTELGKKIGLNQSTMSVIARYKKPDGKFGLRDCEILEDGSVLIELTEQMTVVSGNTKLDVMILEESGIKANSFADITSFEEYGVAVLSAMPLNLNVVTTPIQGAELESEYDFTALNESLAATKAAEADMIAKNAEFSAKESERQKNENARVEAEKTREGNVQKTITECQTQVKKTIDECNDKIDSTIEKCKNDTDEAVLKATNATTAAMNAASGANTAADSANTAATNATTEAQNCQKVYETISESAGTVIDECETARDRANAVAQECENIVIGTGMVMQSEKGVAGGVASLDDTGKVPTEQLPEIKSYDVGGDELGVVKNGGNVIISPDGTMNASNVYDWAKQPTKPEYTAEEVGADPQGTAETVMSGDITPKSIIIDKAVKLEYDSNISALVISFI